ncbi:hypothetical protein [Aquimarina latercula]|uniref:hypothetical protein n=1 Tax=Aquimarina latercula TaxID=987 RepID=UPI0012DD8F04|nr:hypothetical protein [Aquimarina latercula]
MKKRIKSIIPILILIIFTSCDPGVVNKYVVENRTESELKIDSKLKFENRSITEKDSVKNVEINPTTELIIAEYGEIGNAHDKGIDFLNGIDTIIVKMDNRTLRKNINDRKNWKYRVLKNGLLSMDEVEYKLILTEKDFE